MNRESLQNGLRTGITFAVVVLFLVLIGFTVTGATLLSRILTIPVPSDTMPETGMLALFLGLVGLWAGAVAGRVREPDRYLDAAGSGLTAGGLIGLVIGLFAFWMGTIYAAGADLRAYLSLLSPASIELLIFNQNPATGALYLFFVFVLSGLVGGLLARLLRGQGRQAATSSIRQKVNQVLNTPAVKQVRVSRWTKYGLIALGLVIVAILPQTWGSYWNYVMGLVGIYVILGLGLNIIVGQAGQLMLGYVAFFAIGAYTVALLNAPNPHHLMWGFWIALVIGIVLAALTGILLGLPILSLRGDYLAIVTLGFGEIIRILLKSDAMSSLTGGPQGVQNIAGPTIFGMNFNSDVDFMYLILIAMAVTVWITWRVQSSQVGRQWVAIREDEIVAKATGINTFRSKLLALALGAAFAGLGGALFAVRNQFTGPEDHVLMVSINVLALVIVGGMGSIPGIILGAFALKGLPEILRDLENYRLMVFGALLVVMMILRPEGLWPAKRPNLEKIHPPDRDESTAEEVKA